MEQRANIKCCVKLEKKCAKTYELMKKVYSDDCMSRTQVYTWFTRFKNLYRLLATIGVTNDNSFFCSLT